MSSPGAAVPPPEDGQARFQALLDAGTPLPLAQQWKTEHKTAMLQAGAPPDQVDKYWGDNKPTTTGLDHVVAQNTAAAAGTGIGEFGARVATNPFESFAAGLDMSVTHLLQHAPKTVQPENAGMLSDIAYGTGTFLGDLPATVAGLVAGGAAGGALGSEVPVIGNVTGAVLGAGAGSAAVPEAIRQVAVDGYRNGDFLTSKDILTRSATVAYNTTKAAVEGAAGAVIGGKAGETVLAATGSKVLSAGAEAVGYSASATAVGSAMEGKIPDAKDFVNGAVMLLGFHAAGKLVGATKRFVANARAQQVARNMQDIYVKTGVPPLEQVKRAQNDGNLKQQMLAQDVNGEAIHTGMAEGAPPEPPPYGMRGSTTGADTGAGVTAKAYHGTNQDFEAFDTSMNGKFKAPDASGATFFSDDPGVASGYANFAAKDTAGEGANVRPVSLHFQNPKVVDWNGGTYQATKFKSVIDQAKAQGYDGVVFKNVNDDVSGASKPSTVYAAFDPNKATAPHMSIDDKVAMASVLEGSDAVAARQSRQTGKHITADEVVSSAGAIGRYQVMPKVARHYGIDPSNLTDPDVNKAVAKKLMTELTRTYGNDLEAIAIAYNAGPTTANKFLRSGRDRSILPIQTQQYLERGDKAGVFDGNEPEASEAPAAPSGEPPAPGEPEQDMSQASDAELAADTQSIVNQDTKPSLRDRLNGTMEAIYRNYVSELGPAKNLDKALGTHPDDFGMEDAFRMTYSAPERAGFFFRYGTLKPVFEDGVVHHYEKTSGDSYVGAMAIAEKKGGDAEGFENYRLSKRTVEKAEQGIETGQKLSTAQEIVKRDAGKYEEADKAINRVKNASLDYAVDSGLYSAEAVKNMKEANKSHIPFKRAPESPNSIMRQFRGGKFQARQTIKTMKGSDLKIIDPTQADIANLHSIITMSDRNQAANSVVHRAMENKAAHIAEKISGKEAEEVVGKDAKPVTDDPAVALEIHQTYSRRLGPNDFIRYNKGVPEVWRTPDPALAAMIRTGTKGNTDMAVGIAQSFAKVQRSGITSMPDYLFRMTTRDQFTTSVLDRFGGVPFVNLFGGMMHVIKMDDVYQRFVANGGMGAALVDMDVKYIQRDINTLFKKAGTFERVRNIVPSTIAASQLLMERIDAMSRLGYAKRGEANGISPVKAAMRGRKGFLDFSESAASEFVRGWASVTPFLRPNILGLDQLAHSIKTNPLGTMVRGAAYITAPTAALYVMNYIADQDLPDGQKWSDLPRWERDTMWILPPVGGIRLRIPRPQVIGPVFGGLVERMLDHFVQHDPQAFKDWGGTLLSQLIPPLVPAVVLPMTEAWANKSQFTGKPLVPTSLEDASGPMQYTPTTSELSKKISQIIGPPGANVLDVSPIVLDNYVRDWSGTAGPMLLKLLNVPLSEGARPWQVADLPIVGSFIARNQDMGAAPIQDFYDNLDKFKTAHKDFALALKRGNTDEIMQAKGDKRAFLNLQNMADVMQQQAAAIQGINSNKTMTSGEKADRIESIYEGMIRVSQSGNKVMNNYR